MPPPPYLIVGRLRRPHGTEGELYVELLTDVPDETFRPEVELRIGDDRGEAPDERFPPLRIAEVRPFKEGLLVRFEGLDDRDRADLIRSRYLLRRTEEAPPRKEDELFHHELVGLTVVTRDGKEVGRIREVYEVEPAILLEVLAGGDRELLIPFSRSIVVEWDLEAGRLVVDPPEGLLEL